MKWAIPKFKVNCLPASWLKKATSSAGLMFQFCLPKQNYCIFTNIFNDAISIQNDINKYQLAWLK